MLRPSCEKDAAPPDEGEGARKDMGNARLSLSTNDDTSRRAPSGREESQKKRRKKKKKKGPVFAYVIGIMDTWGRRQLTYRAAAGLVVAAATRSLPSWIELGGHQAMRRAVSHGNPACDRHR